MLQITVYGRLDNCSSNRSSTITPVNAFTTKIVVHVQAQPAENATYSLSVVPSDSTEGISNPGSISVLVENESISSQVLLKLHQVCFFGRTVTFRHGRLGAAD